MPLRGVIFDLDGTLVDSRLDFDAIRRDLDLPAGQPILEALALIPSGTEKDRCLAVLRDHELKGADRATLMPGVADFLTELAQRGLKTGILTRNSRESTVLTLRRLRLEFSVVMTRDEVPPKPDPTGLLEICRMWNVGTSEVVYVGDYLFDLLAGKNADIRTVLFAPDGLPDYAAEADYVLRHFSDAARLLVRLCADEI